VIATLGRLDELEPIFNSGLQQVVEQA
jgi:hypothetical protein